MTWGWRRRRVDSFDKPWRTIEYVVVDLETTGLDLRRDSIVSYGAVIIRKGRMITAENRYGLVRPDSALSPKSVTIHTLRPVDLAYAPPLSVAVTALDGLITGRVLVAHAAWIEKAFLRRAYKANGKRLQCNIIDTAAMARAAGIAPVLQKGEPNLEHLAAQLGLPVLSPHHALGDAATTAQVFLALAAKLAALDYHTALDFIDLTTADLNLRRHNTSPRL